MNIKELLKRAKLDYASSTDELEKDIQSIIELIASIPEPSSNLSIKHERFCELAKDIPEKDTKKNDLLKEEMYKI